MANPANVAIICSVERLPWLDGVCGGKCGFGLTVSAAYLASAPDNPRAAELLPWQWAGLLCRIPSIDVAFVDGLGQLSNLLARGTQVKVDQLTEVDGPGARFAPVVDFARELAIAAERALSAAKDAGPLVWTPPPSSDGPPPPSEYTAESPPFLHDRLAELSTAPYPIPQLLNLSFTFQVDVAAANLAGPAYLLARPSLGAAWGITPVPLVNGAAAPAAPAGAGPRPVKWDYERCDRPAYTAVVAPCALALPPNSDGVDWSTGWVIADPAGGAAASGNWVTPLRQRLGDAFDLPQRLIESFRDRCQSGAPVPLGPNDPQWFRDAVLATLRDVLGTGRPPTGGPSLARTAFLAVGSTEQFTICASAADLMDRAVEAWEQGVVSKACVSGPSWEQILASVVTSSAALSSPVAPTCRPNDPVSLAACRQLADGLQDLHDRAFKPENAAAIVVAQWTAAANADATPAGPTLRGWWGRNLDAVRDYLTAAPLRTTLLQANLDRRWSAVRDAINGRSACAPVQVSEGLPRELQELPTRIHDLIAGQLVDRLIPLGDLRMTPGKAAATPKPFMPGPAGFRSVPAQPWVSDDFAHRFADSLVAAGIHAAGANPAPGAANGVAAASADDSATQAAHPLVIPVLPFQAHDDDPSADADDVLRRAAGIGVLLRAETPDGGAITSWRHLTVGAPALDPGPVCPALMPNLLTTCRPSYIADLRQSLVTYDNHPVAAGSHSLAHWTAVAGGKGDADDKTVARQSGWPRVRFDPPDYDNGDTFERLPYLTFGRRYAYRAFVRTNSGALPCGLSRGHPACPRPHGLDVPPAGAPAVDYLRRVPVGMLKVHSGLATQGAGDPAAGGDPLALPDVPRTVASLARELGCTALDDSADNGRPFFFTEGVGTLPLAPVVGAGWQVSVAGIRPVCRGAVGGSFGRIRIALWDAHRCHTRPAAPRCPLVLDVYHALPSCGGGAELRVKVWLGDPTHPAPKQADTAVLPAASTCSPVRAAIDGGFSVTITASVEPGNCGVSDVCRLRVAAAPPDGPSQVVFKWDGPRFPFDLDTPRRDMDPPRPWGVVVSDPGRPSGHNRLAFAPPIVTVNGRPASDDRAGTPPLILLSPMASAAVPLVIEKPSLDPITCDRMVAGRVPLKARAEQLAAAIRAMESANPVARPTAGTAPAALPPDPVVADWLLIERVPLRTANPARTARSDLLPGGHATQRSGLAAPAGSYAVSMMFHVDAADGTGEVRAIGPADALAADVLPGEIWEFRLSALVERRWFRTAGSHGPISLARANGLRQYDAPCLPPCYALPAYRVLVEAASVDLPSPAGLWSALSLATEPGAPPADLVARLDLPTAAGVRAGLAATADPRPDEFVGRVEVLRQLWLPTGRPVDPFPAAQAGSIEPPNADGGAVDLTLPIRWEAQGFADRQDWDVVQFNRPTHVGDRDPADRSRPPVVFREPIAADLRALYYRIGLRAVSRYEGLVPPATQQRGAAFPVVADQGGFTTPWRRQFVPCRRPDAAPARPKVQFVLPLTQPVTEPPADGAAPTARAATPPLLVVLDEPWHEFAGLAEELVVSLDHDRSPIDGQPAFAQTGPDPIRPAVRADELLPPESGVGLAQADVTGPIGGTFDADAEFNPRFASASFVIRVPRMPDRPTGDFGWQFVKLRFRRRVDPEAHADWRDTAAAMERLRLGPGQSIEMPIACGSRTPDVAAGGLAVHARVAPANRAGRLTLQLRPLHPGGRAVVATVDRTGDVPQPTLRFEPVACQPYPVSVLRLAVTDGLDVRFTMSLADPPPDKSRRDDPTAPPAPQLGYPRSPVYRYLVNAEVRHRRQPPVGAPGLPAPGGPRPDLWSTPAEPDVWHCVDSTLWTLGEPLVRYVVGRGGTDTADVAVADAGLIESAPTDAVWAQFIPPPPGDRQALGVGRQAAAGPFVWAPAGNDDGGCGATRLRVRPPVCPPADWADDCQRFAVVCRRIVDAAGADAEVPVGVYRFPEPACGGPLSARSLTTGRGADAEQVLERLPSDRPAARFADDARLRVRILTVHVPRAAQWLVSTEAELWDGLFATAPAAAAAPAAAGAPNVPADARGRPVGLSLAIDLEPAQADQQPSVKAAVARRVGRSPVGVP